MKTIIDYSPSVDMFQRYSNGLSINEYLKLPKDVLALHLIEYASDIEDFNLYNDAVYQFKLIRDSIENTASEAISKGLIVD